MSALEIIWLCFIFALVIFGFALFIDTMILGNENTPIKRVADKFAIWLHDSTVKNQNRRNKL